MRLRYLVPLCVLGAMTLGSVVFLSVCPLCKEQNSRVANAVQVLGIGVALFTAVVALAVADPKQRRIGMQVQPFILDRSSDEGTTDRTTKPDGGRSHAPETYRVHFEIKNTSGFTLRKPVLIFRVPLDKRYEHEEYGLTFTSDLFSSEGQLRFLTFAGSAMLSSDSLPYWNDNEAISVWIRMALDSKTKPFNVEVSLTGENAEGITKSICIDPAELLSNPATAEHTLADDS